MRATIARIQFAACLNNEAPSIISLKSPPIAAALTLDGARCAR